MAYLKPLLTIAIPTYNRAKFLDRALHYIFIQTHNKNYSIELIVSDNCSTDNTTDIVEKYINKGLDIRYIKNSTNKGADFNIAQCYLEAKGRYVVAFGDDDLFVDGSIKQILEILNSGDFGVLFLNQVTIKNEFNLIALTEKDLDVIVFNDPAEFFKKISYYVTFISANIISTKYLDKMKIHHELGSNLVQVRPICDAIFGSSQNVYLNMKALGVADVSNSGGYNVFKVFGENLIIILQKILVGTKNEFLLSFIKNDLLCRLFPFWLIQSKKSVGGYDFSDSWQILDKYFKKSIKYWIVFYPISKLSFTPARIYFFVLRKLKIA